MPSDAIVHIVDDDDAVRDSIEFLLDSAGIKAKSHSSARALLEHLPDPNIGCVITDIRMPDISGTELLRRLKEIDSQLPVIVITGHGDVPLAVEAMKLGAADFFEKPFDDDTMIASIRAALDRNGDSGSADAKIVEIRARLTSLTAREREVLDGLVEGRANKVIAYDLGISPRTVEVYRANVMTKMQASSLSELVRMALLSGAMPDGLKQ